ncbi:unnamed protein product [Rhizophagus irregularis]|nr:unnamed protein product [Rhizophagus irregularis]
MASTCLQRRGFSNIGNFLSEKQKGLFAVFNLEKRNGFFGVLDLENEMIFQWFDFRKRETERRLDDEFRNEPILDVWMMNFEMNQFRTFG